MKRSVCVWVGVLLGLVWLNAGPAVGGGFFLYEQSVKSLGNAYAGAESSAEDAGTIFYNPAGITQLPGSQFELGANVVIPSAKFDNRGSTTSPLPGGAPLTGGDGGDAGKAGVGPNFYTARKSHPVFTPVPNSRLRTPRIPDANRFWTSLGLTWSFSRNFGLDLAHAHFFVNDSKINKSGLESEDYTCGALKGDYDASVNIISGQLSCRF